MAFRLTNTMYPFLRFATDTVSGAHLAQTWPGNVPYGDWIAHSSSVSLISVPQNWQTLGCGSLFIFPFLPGRKPNQAPDAIGVPPKRQLDRSPYSMPATRT